MRLNTAVWEYRHSVETSEEFFRDESPEALTQILLKDSPDPMLRSLERHGPLAG